MAHQLGIRTAFQEISLVPDLTVAQNFLLMEEPLSRLGLVVRRRAEEMVGAALAGFGLDRISPRTKVATLDLPLRQKIEIARSASREPKLLLLDEPTASLSGRDVAWLAEIIARRRETGSTTVFISHRMQEVREFCDVLTILRNGKAVGTFEADDIADEQVIETMIGRSLDVVFPAKGPPTAGADRAPALSAAGLKAGRQMDGISLDLHPGQILGVGGLEGMGQRELFLALFGALPLDAGEIRVHGEPVSLHSPADAIGADIGISLVPEDRKTEGLFLEFDGRQNVSLPSLGRFVSGGLVRRRDESSAALDVLEQVQVPPRALYLQARQFSGGNQQKIVIAKWLLTGSRVLLLYDPTRGVDIGTKAEIYRIMHDFAGKGGCILLYSSEVGELVNLCNDVLVLYRGRVAERLNGSAVTETQIMRAALGGAPAETAAQAAVRVH
ncbi:MAG: sugar ABC transporter ATP-binding protein [Alphaproteobacteria bacterium]